MRYARNRAEVFAAQDRKAGKIRLRLLYRVEGVAAVAWPGEEYQDWAEAWEQAERFGQRFPGAEFLIEEVRG
jgi:hypothetical protein